MEIVAALAGIVAVVAVVIAVRSTRRLAADRAHEAALPVDPLTGLPTRAALERWLDDLLHTGRRTSARVAVVALELPRFGYLNDAYGHPTGDALLAATAERLRGEVGRDELLVRFGGPQFIVAVPSVADAAAARARATHLVEVLGRPHRIGPDRIRPHVVAGVVLTDQHYASAADVLLDARVALGMAAGDRTTPVAVLDRDKRGFAVPSVTVRRLAAAVDGEEFSLRYRPVVALDGGRTVGTRALLRWDDPTGGTVTPDRFAPALDESGLVVPVGRWSLREACRQASEWAQAGGPDHPLADLQMLVDVSPRQLLQSDVAETIDTALAATGLEPGRLCLVVTESGVAADAEPVWAALREVQARGVRLALADFGVASASLSHLRRFRVDVLGIHPSFVTTIADSAEDETVLTQLVQLAHALGIQTLAVGVDRAEVVEVLRRAGCDLAEGDALGPVGSATETAARLAA